MSAAAAGDNGSNSSVVEVESDGSCVRGGPRRRHSRELCQHSIDRICNGQQRRAAKAKTIATNF